MSAPFQNAAFTLGEVAPSLFGRQDLSRTKVGLSTCRNGWPRYSGGVYSRAGTAFTGFSKQTGRTYPPRLIPFQFNINQGLALEFGNFYMRVVANGAYVIDASLPISAISQSNPVVVTATADGVTAATPVTTGVTATYAPGDLITLAGGVFAQAAVLSVTNTLLLSTAVFAPGLGYVPGDTIAPTGGTQSTPAQLTVATTQVVSAAVANAGTGGTDGIQTLTGTTGTGTKFQVSAMIASGSITAILAVSQPGSYTVNPTTLTAEPVTGAGLSGATLNIKMGVHTVTVSTPGVFTANPAGATFTQGSTSGTGTGASFQNAVLGPNAVTVSTGGTYTTLPVNPVSQSSTTGGGLGATFTCTFAPITSFSPTGFNVGDWVQVQDVVGMTQMNNRTFVISARTTTTFSLQDIYGNNVDSTLFTAYISGGTISRIMTVTAPYAEADLEWLKFTQSADVMSLCCVNQDTNVTYQPYDLTRTSDTTWTFAAMTPAPTIGPPQECGVSWTPVESGQAATFYNYVVTAISGTDGSESIASNIASVTNGTDLANIASTNTVNWTGVAGAVSYNVYRSAVSYNSAPPSGTPMGLLGSTTGTNFADSGFVPDLSMVPPTYTNPFVGSNNYPGTVAYFQERRVYADTLAQPDTYFMSQPGAFKNFDVRDPTIDSDAITGAPWAVQVDGIQFMIDMPGGLVVLTGKQAWQLTGSGGSSFNPQAVTPTTEQAQPQAFNGCSSHVPPIRIDYDILYVQAKGSRVRDLSYQYFQNIYTGTDLTVNSSHLFDQFQIQEWAWCEEPYKLCWLVRTDGVLLSLTYLKPEQIMGWARHDTKGSFVSVCSVTEPPVDALYVACQRQIGANLTYTVERMDNRIWSSVDNCWCVDCGLSLPQPQPPASLMISSGNGLGAITSATLVDPGNSSYSALTTATVVDDNGLGPGTGAVAVVTVAAGVPNVTFSSPGQNYVNPMIVLTDPAGSEGGQGAVFSLSVSNTVNFTTSGAVFSPGDVGSVIRAAGGQAMITSYTSPTQVTGNVVIPFVNVIPTQINGVSITSPETFTPVSQGNWTLTAPVSTVTGLMHLAGATVTGVADGQVIPPQVVSPLGTINLPTPASNVVVGLQFTTQYQSLYFDPSTNETVQGQRKKLAAVTARVEASRGFEIGANQVDGSTLSPMQIAPQWNSLTVAPDLGEPAYGSTIVPLATGDVRIVLPGGFNTRGQVALQQRNPLPLNLLSLISEDDPGDTVQLKTPAPPQASRGRLIAA